MERKREVEEWKLERRCGGWEMVEDDNGRNIKVMVEVWKMIMLMIMFNYILNNI